MISTKTKTCNSKICIKMSKSKQNFKCSVLSNKKSLVCQNKILDTLLLTRKILSRVLKLSLKPNRILKEKHSPIEKVATRKDNKNKPYFQI
jgi:hypothetical protein